MSLRIAFTVFRLFDKRGGHIQALVNSGRNRLNFRAKLLLNTVQVEAVFIRDKVDRQAHVSKSTTTANPVKIGFGVLGKVKVDHNVHSLNINTTGEQIRAHQVTTSAISEIMEHTVAMRLEHLGV